MIEFAIIAPVLLMIIFGIIAFGIFLNDQANEQQLASQAARYAAVDVNPASSGTLQAYILSQGNSDVKANGHVYLYYPTCSSGTAGSSGCPVKACVTTSFTAVPLIPFLASQTITQTATMRLEQTPSNFTVDTSHPGCS